MGPIGFARSKLTKTVEGEREKRSEREGFYFTRLEQNGKTQEGGNCVRMAEEDFKWNT